MELTTPAVERRDEGAVLVLTLLLTVVMAMIAVALASYAATGLRTSRVTDVRLAEESAATAAIEYVADALAVTNAAVSDDPCAEVLPIEPTFWDGGVEAEVRCSVARRSDRLSIALTATSGPTSIEATIDVRSTAVEMVTGRRPVAIVDWSTSADLPTSPTTTAASTTTAAPTTTAPAPTTTAPAPTTTAPAPTTTTTVRLPPRCSFEVVSAARNGKSGEAELAVDAVTATSGWAIELRVPSDVRWEFDWPDGVAVKQARLPGNERSIEVSGRQPLTPGKPLVFEIELERDSGTRIDRGDTLDCFGR